MSGLSSNGLWIGYLGRVESFDNVTVSIITGFRRWLRSHEAAHCEPGPPGSAPLDTGLMIKLTSCHPSSIPLHHPTNDLILYLYLFRVLFPGQWHSWLSEKISPVWEWLDGTACDVSYLRLQLVTPLQTHKLDRSLIIPYHAETWRHSTSHPLMVSHTLEPSSRSVSRVSRGCHVSLVMSPFNTRTRLNWSLLVKRLSIS